MGCSACSRKKKGANKAVYDVMGGFKHLPNNQIKARLEIFKKRHCKNCDYRYKCDFVMYNNCNIKPK